MPELFGTDAFLEGIQMSNIPLSRRQILSTALDVSAATALAPILRAAEKSSPHFGKFQIGVCDWMTGKGGNPQALQWASTIGLDGVQISFGAPGDKFDLRKPENRALYTQTARDTNLKISSLGMGILNNIPYKSDPRTEEWVSDAIDAAQAMPL